MKKYIILACMALICNLAKANNSESGTALLNDDQKEIATFITEDGLEISSEFSSFLEAYLFYCATATVSIVDSDGEAWTGTGTCCSDISGIADMCAASRADANLTAKLYAQY